MRPLTFALGVLLLIGGLSGLLVLGLGPRDDVQRHLTQALAQLDATHVPEPGSGAAPEVAGAAVEPVSVVQASAAGPAITRVVLPSARLDSEVVAAPLIRVGDAQTWEVPAYKAGHAVTTAGAGAPGNAVLIGHVSSLNAGNVFKDLERAQVGDVLTLFGGEAAHQYRVVELRRIPREDASILNPTDEPSATLLTCTGTWLPALGDFSHRLAVRAVLAA